MPRASGPNRRTYPAVSGRVAASATAINVALAVRTALRNSRSARPLSPAPPSSRERVDLGGRRASAAGDGHGPVSPVVVDNGAMPATKNRSAVDPTCAAAVELARAAAQETAEGSVGAHLGVHLEDSRVATHRFACTDSAYRGWYWAVTVARASRAKAVTVDEVVLLPGEGALLPPAWLPWSERLRPGDLGVGDVLPTTEDDERLVPAYAAGDDPLADELAWELGLGRVRVLSLIGRDEAAQRWHEGQAGPGVDIAKAAPARCDSCGFLAPLSGGLRQVFGVCANEFAPDDGRVVARDHGCGAHSEAAVVASAPRPTPALADDEVVFEPPTHPAGSVDDAELAEDLGHS